MLKKNFNGGITMEYFAFFKAVIESGLKLEIDNDFEIQDDSILVKLSDNMIASISLE